MKLEYNILDTNDFIQKIDAMNNSNLLDDKNILFCTFDIEAMFPSITKDLGFKACSEHLEKREDKMLFSTDCIIDAIDITLDHNLTLFNNQMFKQCKGTAMGASNACDYADVAMNLLDELVHEEDLVLVHNQLRPLMFSRFRDDIFVLWNHGREKLIEFFNFLNSYHPAIKFTRSEPNNKGVEFLDTYVFLENGMLCTRPYSKECDNHAYLHPSSCHPLHTLENIPYNIAHRVFKLSSSVEIYNETKIEYSSYLEKRGYSKDIISSSFQKVEKLNRRDLIYNRKNDKNATKSCFPFVCDFNPALPPVGRILNKYKYILELDGELTKVIDPKQIFVSYRGNKTIKSMLVPSKLAGASTVQLKDEPLVPVGGSFPCTKGCKFCKLFLDSPAQIWSYHTEQKFNFKYNITCETPNIIYKIDDVMCKKTYVGSTVTGISKRWSNHKSHIRNGVSSCELTSHFCSESNNVHALSKKMTLSKFDDELKKQLRVTLIDVVETEFGDDTDIRIRKCKLREAYWQNQLKTFSCFGGLNKRDARKETVKFSTVQINASVSS